MRRIVFTFAFAVSLSMGLPAAAAPEEVMPIVEDAHESVLRKVFVATHKFLERINYNEEKAKEIQRWENENAYGVGIRG